MVNKRLLVGLVLIVTTAGCMGVASDLVGGDAPVDQTPDSTELIMDFDMEGLQDDPETNELSEILNDDGASGADIDEVESEFEDEFDIDPDDINTVLVFVDDIESSEQFGENNFGVIAHGAFDTDAVVDTIREEESDLTETEYKDQPLYTSEDRSLRGDTAAVGILGDGQIVFGDQQSVESAIDVSVGDADSVSGDLRSEYDAATDEGLVAVVSEVPDDLIPEQGGPSGVDLSVFESVNIVSFTYYTPDGQIGADARFLAESSSDAEDIQSVLDAALVTFGDTGIPEVDDEIDNIETEQDGNAVTARYEGSLDDIETILDTF